MRGKRNIDRVPRGKRKPYMPDAGPEWVVTAKEVAGAALQSTFTDEEAARRHADWWHGHPTLLEVEIVAPAYTGIKHYPTEQDVKVGEAFLAVLDSIKIAPSMKLDINRWMDSKAWGGSLSDQTV